MEYWEFLLQKEGDRSWVPVKSLKLELEAGRYRVVAHSSLANTDVEIYVTHHSLEEVPPKRRSQKRSRRTNPEGLMVVIPFTYLKPGLWELRCCGDVMSDFMGKSWQQAVQLHILPKATEVLSTPKPTSPVEDATQADGQSARSETVRASSEREDNRGETEALASHKQAENDLTAEVHSKPVGDEQKIFSPPHVPEFPCQSQPTTYEHTPTDGRQPSELTHGDSSSKPIVEESEAVVDVGTESSSLLPSDVSSTAPTPLTSQDGSDITVEPIPTQYLSSSQELVEPESTEIEPPPVTPLVADVEEFGSRDEELEVALEGTDSEYQEELENPEPASEIDQSLDYLLVEDFLATSPFDKASLPMQEDVASSGIEGWEDGAPVEKHNGVENPTETSLHLQLPASPVPSLQSSDKAAIPPLPEPEQEILTESVDEEFVPVNSIESDIFFESDESEENRVPLASHSPGVAMPTNPILDRSLQMLEEVLQQVIDPVIQEFDQPESTQQPLEVTPEPELPLETEPDRPALLLALDEDALVARRDETLTISGQINTLDVAQLNGSKNGSPSTPVFQGTLRYQLRDPQTSHVLLDVRQPLPEQTLPLTFSHSLEIPPDCHTRLFLGKVILYRSTSVPLASQPFSVTADLDELLGAILPGTQVMPVAKMVVHSNTPAASSEDNQVEPPGITTPTLSQAFVDLVNSPQSRQPLPLQPASSKPLPPQIYQPSPERKASKSLQLPKLPNVRAITTVDASIATSTPDAAKVKQNDRVEQLPPSEPSPAFQQLTPANDFSSNTFHEELGDRAEDTAPESEFYAGVSMWEDAVAQEDTLSIEQLSSNTLDDTELSDAPVSVADSELGLPQVIPSGINSLYPASDNSVSTADDQLATSDRTEEPDSATPADDFLLSNWESIEWLDTLDPEMRSAEFHKAQTAANEAVAVDNAFQSLRLHDRFWTRLNSLAADAELSESLKSDLYRSTHSVDEVESTQELNLDAVVFDEDVTQPLNSDVPVTDFDESIWSEESEDFNSAIDDMELQLPPTTALQSPSPEEDTSPASSTVPERLSVAAQATKKWAAQEIVVDDDEELLVPEQPEQPKQSVFTQERLGNVYPSQPLSSPPEPKSFSPRQPKLPLPAPTLFIPTTELSAGEPVTVRAKVPPDSARLCIKLWVQDRQTRSLLDGPRWLVDLLPDGAGKLEAMTQLIIPFGSVEIRFEAIAVDLDSQRESNKVAVDCIVVPPDLPDLSFDEFEQ